jgi:hypothetical protein
VGDPLLSQTERAFLVVRSFVFRSGSISCLGRFVKGFSEQFFVIRKSRLPLSLLNRSKTDEVTGTYTTVSGSVFKRKKVLPEELRSGGHTRLSSTTDSSAKPKG